MKWHIFVKGIRERGFDGDDANFDEVQQWLRENGHDPSFITVKGQSIALRKLWEDREGKSLDLSSSADLAAKEEEIERIVQKRIDDLASSGLLVTRRSMNGNGHPHQVKVGKDRIEDDPCLGYRKEEEGGFCQYLADVRKAAIGPDEVPERLTKAHSILTKTIQQNNETVDREGGFLVPIQHEATLLNKVHNEGKVFPRCRQISMTSKTMEVPYVDENSRANGSRYGGVQGYWVAEGASHTASKPAFSKLTLQARKLACLGYVTDELEEDSTPGAMALVADLFAKEIAFRLDDAVVNGSGSGMPEGFTNSGAYITATQAKNAVLGDGVLNMWKRLPLDSRANAVWFYNPEVEDELAKLAVDAISVVGTGAPALLNQLSAGLQGPPTTLLGRPAIPIEQAGLTTADKAIFLCDMTQYVLGVRRGIQTQSSMHVQFTTDQMAFKVTMRVDGRSWWESALTPYSGSSDTLSPFIGLDTTA